MKHHECPVCGGPMKEPPIPEKITESVAIGIRLRIIEILARREKRPSIHARIRELRQRAELYRQAAEAEAEKVP